jgi:DNA-binding winged helix-turn-helix (wHTH) protein
MSDDGPAPRYRFGIFEADSSTGELRRQGVRIKLNAQPFQVLCLLLEEPGELLTREQICRALWPERTFVDYEHGLNSAINRIREALGDTASNPRYVETLARRGYRFVVPVERIVPAETDPVPLTEPATAEAGPFKTAPAEVAMTEPEGQFRRRILAGPHELPKISYSRAQWLFILFQLMYVGFYVGALANLAEIQDLISVVVHPNVIFTLIVATAAVLILPRAYVLTAVVLHAPGMRERYLKLWPFLLPFDELWALSPFLLLHHINFGVALACTPLLVYAPFAQRSLVLMGAGGTPPQRAETM